MRRAQVCLAIAIVCTTCLAVDARGQTPPSGTDGWVVLPVDEYRTLRDRSRAPTAPQAPPVEATLTRIDYELRLDGDAIAGRARLTIDVLRDGWARVAIPAGLMVRDARLDGRPVPLVKGPPPHVLLGRAGRSVLDLEVAFPLSTAAGSESIVLPASASPISRATLVLPRGGVELSVGGGLVAARAEDAGESRWTTFGRPNEPLTLSWKRRVDDRRGEQPLRFRARVTQVVGLGEDTSHVVASVRIEVLQGQASDILLRLPDGLVVNQVTGATVGDWSVASGALRVRLLEAVAADSAFLVQGEFRAPRDGRIVVPLVRVPEAEREGGGVAVDVVGAGEITGRQVRGLEPTDPSELGDVVGGRESPSMIAFRLRPLAGADDRSLAVTVVRYTPQAVLIANVEEARYRALASEDGRLLVEAQYAVRNNQRSFLKVTLPQRATMWSAAVAGRPTRPGAAEAGALLLPLEKGRGGEEAPTFVVTLVYLQSIDAWPDKGRVAIALPALDLPVSRTGLQIFYSPRFQIQAQPGSLRVESDPGPFAEALRMSPGPTAAPAGAATVAASSGADDAGLQTLVEKYQREPGVRTVAGALPVNVTFPNFGPSLYLASELSAEGRAPSVEIDVRRRR